MKKLMTGITMMLCGAAMAAPVECMAALGSPKPIHVMCANASGYYGAVNVRQLGTSVEVYVKGGIAIDMNEFTKSLGLTSADFVPSAKLMLRAAQCERAADDIHLRCTSSRVVMSLAQNGQAASTVVLKNATITLAPEEEGTRATITATRLSDQGVELTATTTDTFGVGNTAYLGECVAK